MHAYEIAVFTAFLLISTTSLLPWNLFMNAHEYYNYKLRNVSDEENITALTDGNSSSSSTELQRSYEAWVTLTSGLSCALGSGLNFLTTERLGNSFRIRAGHATVLLALVPTVLLTFINTDFSQLAFFWGSMLLASLASFGSIGLIGCGLLGFAAKFPSGYVQAVMIGQSVAGILSALLSIVCQGFAANALLNGRFFFVIACIWTILSVFVYELLIRSNKLDLLIVAEMTVDEPSNQRLLDNDENDLETDEQPLYLRSVETHHSLWNDAEQIWNKTKLQWWAGFIVLVGTLSGFPALSSLVETTAKNVVWRNYFTSVACFLLFNCGDALGRLLVNFILLGETSLMSFSLLRLLAIPLFFFCNINPRYHSVTFFQSDKVFIATMVLFSISNGFLFTTANVSATRKVNSELRELTGSLFGFMGVISTLCGSLIGLVLVKSV